MRVKVYIIIWDHFRPLVNRCISRNHLIQAMHWGNVLYWCVRCNIWRIDSSSWGNLGAVWIRCLSFGFGSVAELIWLITERLWDIQVCDETVGSDDVFIVLTEYCLNLRRLLCVMLYASHRMFAVNTFTSLWFMTHLELHRLWFMSWLAQRDLQSLEFVLWLTYYHNITWLTYDS